MALIEEIRKQGSFLFKYRGQFPVLFIVLGLIVFLWPWWMGQSVEHSEPARWVYLFVGLSGQLIRALVIGYTPRGTSGRNREKQIADSLNTLGMYSIVRHPLYLGNFLMWLSCVFLIGNIYFTGVFILMFWIFYERIMFVEEDFLRSKYGEDYLKWAENVPAFFPRKLNWISPKVEFSWKNILKREYYGFFSLFFLFALFNILSQYVENQYINWLSSWLLIFYLVAVFTLVLRILKKNTHLFHVEGR